MALTEVNSLGIKDLEVKTADIAADAVTGAKIADDQIDSEHYVDGSIDHQHLADDAVDGDIIADNAVGLAHMAGGTDGVIITYDASGNPVHVGPGTDGQVLTSTGAGSPPAFEAVPAGGATINNATANELVTVASTTTQLDAEANLTFDGNDLTLGDGNIIFAAGHGIDFSAQSDSSASGTSTTAELFSHYEEGTWTPEINGADGGEYTMGGNNNGHYVRVGALVFCSCTLHWTGQTTAYSGMAVINGLPFQNNGARSAVTFGPYTAGSLVPDYGSSGSRHQNGVLDPSQSRIYPTEQQEDGGYGHGPIVGTSGIVYGITVVYETDAAN
jgi:hypothetical protein